MGKIICVGRVCNAGALLDQLQVLQTLHFNSFYSCLCPTLVLVAVSPEPALLQINSRCSSAGCLSDWQAKNDMKNFLPAQQAYAVSLVQPYVMVVAFLSLLAATEVVIEV